MPNTIEISGLILFIVGCFKLPHYYNNEIKFIYLSLTYIIPGILITIYGILCEI